MNKYEIINTIEKFAPPELAEKWDCSGFCVETQKTDIKKIMLALTVTDDVVLQAKQQNCDMIISHHPLFEVPLNWQDIDIYCAHTNLDRTIGGTTDTLIKKLGLTISESSDFLRFVEEEFTLEELLKRLTKISPNLRYVNNKNIKTIKKIAFCAGSGAEFIQEAYQNGADALVTGDIKFHTALESPLILFDIGHFESEILVLEVFESLLRNIETVRAEEKSPFIQIKS